MSKLLWHSESKMNLGLSKDFHPESWALLYPTVSNISLKEVWRYGEAVNNRHLYLLKSDNIHSHCKYCETNCC